METVKPSRKANPMADSDMDLFLAEGVDIRGLVFDYQPVPPG
jgi:hypothetical protein